MIRFLKDTVSSGHWGQLFFNHDIMLLSPRPSPDLMISSFGPAPFPNPQVLKEEDRADPAADLAGFTGELFDIYRDSADSL